MSTHFGHKTLLSFPSESSHRERQRTMRQSFCDFCSDNKRFDLLVQWDTDANLPLTPKSVTSGSSQKIWWFCKSGHHWQQEPWVRTSHGGGCPVCAGKVKIRNRPRYQRIMDEASMTSLAMKNTGTDPP